MLFIFGGMRIVARRPVPFLRHRTPIGIPLHLPHLVKRWSHLAPSLIRHQRWIPSSEASPPLGAELPTIYALSTAPGRAAIAVIRISGSAALEVYKSLCPSQKLPTPRRAAVRILYDPLRPAERDAVLDPSALLLYFPAPRTVTGEDVLELHVHGGPAVVQAVLKAIPQCFPSRGRIRYAEAGEFTWRGFSNGRLDLTQVEALGDVLSAETEQQRRLSVRGTEGRLAKQYERWREMLLYARGELEALIDFQEDQHFDESPTTLAISVATQIQSLVGHISVHIGNAVRGELLRKGISIALLGAPNVGKSSLLNRIVGREAAIVSTEAGTTRDVVEVSLDIKGYFCRMGDLAGLRSHDLASGDRPGGARIGLVEEEGIRRAKERALVSDLVIVVSSVELDPHGHPLLTLDDDVVRTAQQCQKNGAQLILVINKSDLLVPGAGSNFPAFVTEAKKMLCVESKHVFLISCRNASEPTPPSTKTGGNIQLLLQGLANVFDDMTAALVPSDTAAEDPTGSGVASIDRSIWQESLGASERHRLLLEECLSHLEEFVAQVNSQDATNHGNGTGEVDIVVAAESLRMAADCLAKITGRGGAGDVEEVLGVVFSKFCVGK